MNKYIMFVWVCVIFLFLTLILLIGYKEKDKAYSKVEKELKLATKAYISDKGLTPKISRSVIIYTKDLVDGNYIVPDYLEEYCIKDVVFSNGLFYDEYTIEKDCENKE